MNIRFMETVICLAQCLNFRVTAERLNITPAAVSSRILTIENELGIKLFERDSKDVRITPEGSIFLSGALKIVQSYHELRAQLQPAGDAGGTIRLGVMPSVAPSQLLPRMIRRMEQDYPRLSVLVETDGNPRLLDMLDSGDLDVVIGIKREEHPSRICQPLWNLGMYWVARTGVFPSGEQLGIRDIVSQPIISYARGTLNHDRLLEYLGEEAAADCEMHYSNSLATTINLVEAGIGIAVLPPVVVQDQLRSGTLSVLDVRPVFPQTPYHIMWQRSSSSGIPLLVSEIARGIAREIAGEYSWDLVNIPD